MQHSKISTSLKIPELDWKTLRPYFPKGLVALDLETTGLSPLFDQIIELSALKVTPSGEIETFDQLINPQMPIPEITIAIHGIKDEDVAECPTIKEVLPKFLNFLEDLPILAHNAKFDIGFLVFALNQSSLALPSSEAYCSIKFARQAFAKEESFKLGKLCKSLGLSLKNHHRALDDAHACLQVLMKGISNYAPEHKRMDAIIKESYLFSCNQFKKDIFDEIPAKLRQLIPKIRKQIVVDIKYRGGSHKGEFRPIRPVSFLPMPEGNILYAHCLLSGMYKSFALKKISDIRELKSCEITKRLEKLQTIKQKSRQKTSK